jgi:VIT1/CCC1 family predicted Fe2+/Mn2+ transporter
MRRPQNFTGTHSVSRGNWLRAAVLGANDGILSTSSLILGVAAASAVRGSILLSGVAGLVAGAMAMAAGEYVSVSSQSDGQTADLINEEDQLITNPDAERRELAAIYMERGVTPALAVLVVGQLMAKDALGAHAREELGISELSIVRPVQAAVASAAAFSLGASMPLLMVIVSPNRMLAPIVAASSLLFLALLGAVAAKVGGAPMLRGMTRVTVWGALAMAVTAGIGATFVRLAKL